MLRKSFTLVEVLVVIAIIGIIAGFGVPKFAAYRSVAYAKQRLTNTENIITACHVYCVNNNMIDGETHVFDEGAFEYLQNGEAGLDVAGDSMNRPGTLAPKTELDAGTWTPYTGYDPVTGL